MKFSESWLREWVNPKISTEQLAAQLTMAGLEVDSVEPVAGQFSDVVVGEIMSVQPHPEADKLRICRVKGGPDGDVQVVCGAANAREGLKVPFALVGAVLPAADDGKTTTIKKAKLRGVESFGMLCSQVELQAGDDKSGLWELPADAPTGKALQDYLQLRDTIIDVDLTPNRGDCLGIKGMAREVATLNQVAITHSFDQSIPAKNKTTFPVALEAADACPRYVGRVIKNIDITKPSPLWMQEKLRRSGLRSIDAVVDITNFILLELGQPMHAFDLDKLHGGIHVRKAQADEKIKLLDGQEVLLKADTVVIADQRRAVAMAGIMGGEETAVSETTANLFLECAFFSPTAIAGRARAYGLQTDSSHRFERGVDYNGTVLAIERATQLLLDIVGGEPGPTVVTENKKHLPEIKKVKLEKASIQAGLGMALSNEDVEKILTGLGLNILSANEYGWEFSIPSHRFDIAIEADLLEELARVYGYNKLPVANINLAISLPQQQESRLSVNRLCDHLVARDFQEVITYSFIDPKLQKMFDADVKAVALLNPISADMSIMRTSLLPGLLKTLQYNLNRQMSRVRVFERGMVFQPGLLQAKQHDTEQDTQQSILDKLRQTEKLAGLIYGNRESVGWNADKQWVDFFDLKGDVEALLALTGREFTFEAAQCPALHPGQTAQILSDGNVCGHIGALHPQLMKSLEIPRPVYVFEVALNDVLSAKKPMFEPVSKFPEVSRDLAIVVDKAVTIAALNAEISSNAGNYLKNLKVFDVYSGEGIDPQRKSVAFSLTFQHPSRTLNEQEIGTAIESVVKRLQDKFNGKLR